MAFGLKCSNVQEQKGRKGAGGGRRGQEGAGGGRRGMKGKEERKWKAQGRSYLNVWQAGFSYGPSVPTFTYSSGVDHHTFNKYLLNVYSEPKRTED